MTRVIHTGDTHVGYRQYHSPERREDFLRAFEAVIDDAVADDVDAVVHTGDLFHDRRPALPDLQGVVGALRRLDDAGIPFLAVVGNHEGKRDAQWLDLFEDLGLATRLDDEPHVIGDTAFYGLDFVPRSRRPDLDYEFAPTDADGTALVSHGLFEPFDFADWDTERLLAESTVDFDVLLLGDDHEHDMVEVSDTLLTYCGSTERVSASEREDRGYNIVTFEDGVDVTRRSVGYGREFVFVDVTLREGEGTERVREAVGQHDVSEAVALVTVEGEGDPVTPAPIEEFAAERGALVARVNDRREREEEVATDVTFADPDEAVRERIQELGLSEAARGIDETVRASKVADSNVRESVEGRVRERIEEGDLDAFESAPDAGSEDGSGTDDATTGEDDRAVPEDDDGATGEGDGTATGDEDGATGEGDGTAAGDDDGSDPQDQASMEEYL
ncbi:DNA repair exonuclease [Halobacteriales archaeon QS_8_69_26]|nr:MAG: DNA repair exonuclease [Halobacteriales archaeon QS_8_69_26]